MRKKHSGCERMEKRTAEGYVCMCIPSSLTLSLSLSLSLSHSLSSRSRNERAAKTDEITRWGARARESCIESLSSRAREQPQKKWRVSLVTVCMCVYNTERERLGVIFSLARVFYIHALVILSRILYCETYSAILVSISEEARSVCLCVWHGALVSRMIMLQRCCEFKEEAFASPRQVVIFLDNNTQLRVSFVYIYYIFHRLHCWYMVKAIAEGI